MKSTYKLEEENLKLKKKIEQLQDEIRKLKREEEVSNSFDYDKFEKVLEKVLREHKPVCPGIQYVPYEPSKINNSNWFYDNPIYSLYSSICY